MYTFWSLIKPLTMIMHSWSLIIHWHNLLLHGDVVSQAKFIPIVITSDHHERIFLLLLCYQILSQTKTRAANRRQFEEKHLGKSFNTRSLVLKKKMKSKWMRVGSPSNLIHLSRENKLQFSFLILCICSHNLFPTIQLSCRSLPTVFGTLVEETSDLCSAIDRFALNCCHF